MILIVCLDDGGGMQFNHRRQSRDRVLNAHLLQMAQQTALWMNPTTAKLFAGQTAPQIRVDEEFLQKTGPGEYCFLEDGPALPVLDRVERVVACRWNRDYPRDRVFDVDLTDGSWQLESSQELVGSSHEKITVEVYTR